MSDNLITETIEVAEITVGKTKKGKPLLNISSTDERVWGTTREDLVAEGEKLKLQGPTILVLEYTESQNGQYTNRYIESLRTADGEECRRFLGDQVADEADSSRPILSDLGPSSSAAPAASSGFNSRALALQQAIAYFEVRGPSTGSGQPFAGPTVDEVTELADTFLRYVEGPPAAELAQPDGELSWELATGQGVTR